MPERIQRHRTLGWRIPAGAVYVGRPTIFGNPWRVEPVYKPGIGRVYNVVPGPGQYRTQLDARQQTVDLHRDWITRDTLNPDQWPHDLITAHTTARGLLANLHGRDLACWCPLPEPGQPDHCHANTLLRLANTPKAVAR